MKRHKLNQEHPLSARRAQEVIRRALQRGSYIVTGHAADELRDEGFDNQDLESALGTGSVVDVEWNDEWQEFRYRVVGDLADPEPRKMLGVICAIEENDKVPIITVFSVKK